VSTDTEVRDFVRKYILKEFLPGVPASELTDSTPLISGGILDSLATVKLVAMLEERYKVEIQAHEASITHFNSVADIASLVRDKTGN
jgi:acyl carrier protein